MSELPTCRHPHRRVIAEDEHEKYFECLDCGEIFEAGEIERPQQGFEESLSDA
jgi:hypothetical protein